MLAWGSRGQSSCTVNCAAEYRAARSWTRRSCPSTLCMSVVTTNWAFETDLTAEAQRVATFRSCHESPPKLSNTRQRTSSGAQFQPCNWSCKGCAAFVIEAGYHDTVESVQRQITVHAVDFTHQEMRCTSVGDICKLTAAVHGCIPGCDLQSCLCEVTFMYCSFAKAADNSRCNSRHAYFLNLDLLAAARDIRRKERDFKACCQSGLAVHKQGQASCP